MILLHSEDVAGSNEIVAKSPKMGQLKEAKRCYRGVFRRYFRDINWMQILCSVGECLVDYPD